MRLWFWWYRLKVRWATRILRDHDCECPKCWDLAFEKENPEYPRLLRGR